MFPHLVELGGRDVNGLSGRRPEWNELGLLLQLSPATAVASLCPPPSSGTCLGGDNCSWSSLSWTAGMSPSAVCSKCMFNNR